MTDTNKWGKLDEKLNAPKDEIIIIVDRSGSMRSIWTDSIGGLNSFIDQNKDAGEAFVTLVCFDNVVEYPRGEEKLELLTMEEITDKDFHPRGGTAMNDAIGMTLNGFVPNHPDAKVAVVIVTDGDENSSMEYTDRGVIKEMVTEKEALGWNFTFLAANLDAFGEANSFGMTGATMDFAATGAGVRQAYAFASAETVSYRTGSVKRDPAVGGSGVIAGQPQVHQGVDIDLQALIEEQQKLDSHNQ